MATFQFGVSLFGSTDVLGGSYIALEDGSGRLQLEDATGDLLVETALAAATVALSGSSSLGATLATHRRARVTWASVAVPAAAPGTTTRRARVSWASMTITPALRRARITWASVAVPSAAAPGGIKPLSPYINVAVPQVAGATTVGSTLTLTPGTWTGGIGFAGTSSLGAVPAARRGPFTAAIQGVSALTVRLTELHRFAVALAGSSRFAVSLRGGTPPFVGVGFAGTSSLLPGVIRVPAPSPTPTGNTAPFTTYLVEVAWGQQTGGLFTFGVSSFGSTTDRLAASSWSAAFNVPFADLSSRTRHMTIVRGRDDLLSNMQAGTLTLDLSDPDGLLNYKNVSSPLYGALWTGVPIRVSGYTSAGTQVGLYYGFISTITSDPGGRYGTAQITAIDFFARLQRDTPNLDPLSGATTGSAIRALLAALNWTDPAMLRLDTGDVLPDPWTRADGDNESLNLIEELLQTERGYFYISGSGAVVYRSRYSVLLAESLAQLGPVMASAPATLDESRVRNWWTVTRADMLGNAVGVPQEVHVDRNDISYLRYGYLHDNVQNPNLRDDDQALALGEYLLALTKTPAGVGWQVPIQPPDSDTLDQLLLRDLGDRVTLAVNPINWPNYTADYTIEQIKHEITTEPSAPRHVTTWGVAEIPAFKPFVFGSSTFGGADVLPY